MNQQTANPSVGIIDPVGQKAGMMDYDLALSGALRENNLQCTVYSNFDPGAKNYFKNIRIAKTFAVINNFTGFIRSISSCKQTGVLVVIIHIFRGGLFDLVTTALCRITGIKVIAIVHDIESLDTAAMQWTRTLTLKHLVQMKVVHNQYSYRQLEKMLGTAHIANTAIIPHGNFASRFPAIRPRKEESIAFLSDRFKISKDFFSHDVILFFGQIKKVKGLDILLDAMQQCNCNLFIAGRLRNESFERYSSLIDAYHLQSRVFSALEYIEDETRNHLFNISKAVVLPYRKVYQSGVLLTAMSYPVPVIASDLPANAEMIIDGKTGFLFKSGNAGDLAVKINLLLQSDTASVNAGALATVLVKHSWSYIGLRFSEIIRALVPSIRSVI